MRAARRHLLGDHVVRREVELQAVFEVADEIRLGPELGRQLLRQEAFVLGLTASVKQLILHQNLNLPAQF